MNFFLIWLRPTLGKNPAVQFFEIAVAVMLIYYLIYPAFQIVERHLILPALSLAGTYLLVGGITGFLFFILHAIFKTLGLRVNEYNSGCFIIAGYLLVTSLMCIVSGGLAQGLIMFTGFIVGITPFLHLVCED